MPRVDLTIPGDPKAKGRPRATTIGNHARLYTPAKTARWESVIRAEAAPLFPEPIPAGVPVRVALVFWFALPESQHRKREPVEAAWLPAREDWDNLGKLVCDALNGIAWVDDRQIVRAVVEKHRCGQLDNRPRTEVVIEWEGPPMVEGHAPAQANDATIGRM